MATKYEFAIKQDVLNSGKTIYTPVCRRRGPLFFTNPWERIVRVYDEYILMELDFIPNLTYNECKQHIEGYQEKLMEMISNDVATVEFHTLEEKEI